jgi:prophage maintenance system killer protein
MNGAAGRYPTVADVVGIHGDLVAEYPGAEAGVDSRAALAFVLDVAGHERLGVVPGGVHATAQGLLGLLVAVRPFVDANGPTALNVAAVHYRWNGYRLDYGHGIERFLAGFRGDADSEAGRTDARAGDAGGTGAGNGAGGDGGGDGPAAGGRALRSYLEAHATAAEPSTADARAVARADREAHRPVYDALADGRGGRSRSVDG